MEVLFQMVKSPYTMEPFVVCQLPENIVQTIMKQIHLILNEGWQYFLSIKSFEKIAISPSPAHFFKFYDN